jgi:hypothetical protein
MSEKEKPTVVQSPNERGVVTKEARAARIVRRLQRSTGRHEDERVALDDRTVDPGRPIGSRGQLVDVESGGELAPSECDRQLLGEVEVSSRIADEDPTAHVQPPLSRVHNVCG